MKQLVLSAFVGLAGCTTGVESPPSYQLDVQPILAAACVRCHGVPAIGGAPESLRLDAYEDLVLFGAATTRASILRRIGDGARPMPPRFPLDDAEIEVIEAWVASGGGRGAPRADNQRPLATIVARDGGSIVIDVGDPDGDVVGGALLVDGVVTTPLAAGRTQVAVPAGAALRVQLDDGAALIEQELP